MNIWYLKSNSNQLWGRLGSLNIPVKLWLKLPLFETESSWFCVIYYSKTLNFFRSCYCWPPVYIQTVRWKICKHIPLDPPSRINHITLFPLNRFKIIRNTNICIEKCKFSCHACVYIASQLQLAPRTYTYTPHCILNISDPYHWLVTFPTCPLVFR